MELKSTNPATGEGIKKYNVDSEELVNIKINQAQVSFLEHRLSSFIERRKRLLKLAGILREDQNNLALLISSEMGKITNEALAEIEKCAVLCEYYAEQGELFLANEKRTSDAENSYVKYEALGVLLAVMPWNFPFWQVFRFAAPALMAGNTVLLKHASNVTGCALAIERIVNSAGFICNELQSLVIPSTMVKRVIEHEYVKAITLTGSEHAGSQVASVAGKQIKKAVLELGGSDPFIVFADADLEVASQEAIKARFLNCGQSCIAAKRFLIEESVYETFSELFRVKLDDLSQGNPLNKGTTLGPMASAELADELEQQIGKSVSLGATLYGGNRGEYAFFSAGILSDIPKNAPAYKEELFGPIASFYKFTNKEDAIEIANCTSFGLGSSVWTNDDKLINYMVDKLESGSVFVNSMVKSDPRLPFGGIKKSGYGRELSKEGIREFVNIKTVYIR